MKKTIWLLMLLCAGAVWAETVTINHIEEGTKGLRAKDKASGQPLWQSEVRTRRITSERGEPFLLTLDSGAGIYGKEKKNVNWETESYVRIKDRTLVPYQVKQTIKDQSGQTVLLLEKSYDPKTKKVYCQVNGQSKTFDFPDDLIDKEMFGTVLANWPLDKKSLNLHLLTHEPTLYKIELKYLGNETVNGVECYKLQMIPDLGALNIFGAFVPKTYFWYALNPPHDFVRYEGLESGLGTPYIVLEAKE